MINQMIRSINNNKKGIVLILFSALCTSVGQAFWKLFENNQIVYLLIGFVLYIIGAVSMIFAFRYGSLSVLHPILSIGYLFAIVIGYLMLGELISTKEIIGIIVILGGVILIGGGDN
ncbi:EamA-like transporter family protein [compost metagenome]